MKMLRNRLGVRDAVLVVALALGAGGLLPSIGIVSAQDPTLQVSQPKTHAASTAETPRCGLATVPATESDVISTIYRRIGLLAE